MENNDIQEQPAEARKGLIRSFRILVKDIFNVKREIDFHATAEALKKDVEFKGFNIWILILSILICSIGLNLNSTAIVIGAMLISPLMGPITGLGFAVGTFDRDLLVKALKNLAVAIVISVAASFLFFKVAPAGLNQSELLSRTKPGVMDLLVATFGGFAGILAGARNIKTNVIPGVAIATALMPPLCTAGFGLATGNTEYFLGAFYLFFINSVFISLSALIVIRYLRFPIASYVDLKTRRKVRNFIGVFVILVSVPSVIIYSAALKQSVFEYKARKFVNDVINGDNRQADNIMLYHTDSSQQISVWVYGDEYSQEQKDSLNNILPNFGLNKNILDLHNMGDYEAYKRLFEKKDQEISKRATDVELLNIQLKETSDLLEKNKKELLVPSRLQIKSGQLNQEAQVLFEPLISIDCLANVHEDDSAKREIPVFLVNWNSMRNGQRKSETEKMKSWLSSRFEKQFDTISVINVYP